MDLSVLGLPSIGNRGDKDLVPKRFHSLIKRSILKSANDEKERAFSIYWDLTRSPLTTGSKGVVGFVIRKLEESPLPKHNLMIGFHTHVLNDDDANKVPSIADSLSWIELRMLQHRKMYGAIGRFHEGKCILRVWDADLLWDEIKKRDLFPYDKWKTESRFFRITEHMLKTAPKEVLDKLFDMNVVIKAQKYDQKLQLIVDLTHPNLNQKLVTSFLERAGHFDGMTPERLRRVTKFQIDLEDSNKIPLAYHKIL